MTLTIAFYTLVKDNSEQRLSFARRRKTYSSNTSLSSMVSSQSSDNAMNNPYIVEDEFHVVWDFDKEAENETHVAHATSAPPAPVKPGTNFQFFYSLVTLKKNTCKNCWPKCFLALYSMSSLVFTGPPKLMRSSSSQIAKAKPSVSKSEKPAGRTIVLKVQLFK